MTREGNKVFLKKKEAHKMNELSIVNFHSINAIPQDRVIFKEDYFQDFLDFNKGRSKRTKENYLTCLKPFREWILNEQIINPTRKDCQRFRDYLDSLPLCEGTKQQYFRAMKHFFKWISSEGIYPDIATNIQGFKVNLDISKKDSFKDSEVEQIIDSIDTTTEKGKRDKAIILLMITCGLRINEARLIDIQDIEEREGKMKVYIQGKGHSEKDDYKFITPEVYQTIEEYLETRPNAKKEEPLFTGTSNNQKGTRITETSFSRLVKDIFKKGGFNSKRLTAHSLRHTSSTILYESGANLYQVQMHSRHKNPKTTEIYIHRVEKDKETSEQDIFNQIFNKNAIKNKREVIEEVNFLSEEQLQKVALYIANLKEGGNTNEQIHFS